MKKVEVCAGELECFWGHHSGKGVIGNVEPVLCPSEDSAQGPNGPGSGQCRA